MPQDVHGDDVGAPNDGRGQAKPPNLANRCPECGCDPCQNRRIECGGEA